MASLNVYNYLNLVGYIINTFVTFLASPIFGFPDNGALSDKYQTIVTPNGLTFSIWGIIFIAEAVFTIAQMFPKFRGVKLVQEGVSYWYFVACMFQSAWTFAFGYEVVPLSAVFMAGILVSLIVIVVRLSKIESEQGKRITDFWLYKFPFSIHCGWIFAAFAVNVNATIVSMNASVEVQTGFAYAAFGYIALVAAFALIYLDLPDFTIPSVLVWATIGIVRELNDPQQLIKDTFEEDFIELFRKIVLGVSASLAAITAGYGVYRVIKTCTKTGKKSMATKEGEEKPVALEEMDV